MGDPILEKWQNHKEYDATLFEKAQKQKPSALFGSNFLGGIFKGGPLSQEEIEADPSYQKAAVRLYDYMSDNPAFRALNMIGSKNITAEEKANAILRFTRLNTSNTSLMIANKAVFAGAPKEIKDALAFTKSAYDLKAHSLDGSLLAVGQTLADPLNLVGGGVAIKVAQKVGVKALAKQGSKFGTTAAFKEVGFKQAFKQTATTASHDAFRSSLSTGMSQALAKKAASKAYKSIVWRGIKIGAVIGAAEGVVTGLVDDYFRQDFEADIGLQDGRNWGRTAGTVLGGTILGGGMAGGGNLLPTDWGKKLLKPLQDNGFLTPTTPSASATTATRNIAEEGAEAAATANAGARVVDLNGQPKAPKTYWQKLDETSYNQIFMGQAAANPFPAWGKAALKIGRDVFNGVSKVASPKYLSNYSWVSRLYMGDAAILEPAALTARGTILPQYHRGFDLFKFWMRRTANPAKLFTNWAPVTNMPLESRPVSRQVFNAVDRLMAGVAHDAVVPDHTHIGTNSIIKKLQALQNDILNDVDAGIGPINRIQAFARNNAAYLDAFKAEMQLLRNHVDTTFTVVANRPDKAKDALWLQGGEHKYYGLNKQQKETLLAHLDELIEMPDELKKGTAGIYGQQILETVSHIQKKKYTTAKVRDSVSGLSRAHYLADMSEVGLTGKYAKTGDLAVHNWKEARARSVQNGFHNNEHFYERPVSIEKISDNNLEKQWQNQVLPFYKTLVTKDDKGGMKSVAWTDPIVSQFASLLAEFHTSGHGHDVNFMIEDLMRRRQQTGNSELYTVPSTEALRKALEALPIFKTDKGFEKFTENILDQTDRWHTLSKGVRGKGLTGLFDLEMFKVNRMNMAEYATQSYIYSMTERYPGTGLVAKPGKYFWNDRFTCAVTNPLKWLAGAKSTGTTIDYDDGGLNSSTVWMGEGEHFGHVIKRGLSRTLTGGLVNDVTFHNIPIINWTILPWPSLTKLGKVALLGGGLFLGGKGCESGLMEGTGSAVWNVATIPVKTEYKVANHLIFGGDKDAENKKENKVGKVVITNPDDGHVIDATPIIADDGTISYMVTVTDTDGNVLTEEDTQKYLDGHPDILKEIQEEQKRYNEQLKNAPNGAIEPAPAPPPAAAPPATGETPEEIETRIRLELQKEELEEKKKEKEEFIKQERQRQRPARKKTGDSRDVIFGMNNDKSSGGLSEEFNDLAGNSDARTMISDNTISITTKKDGMGTKHPAAASILNPDDRPVNVIG